MKPTVSYITWRLKTTTTGKKQLKTFQKEITRIVRIWAYISKI